MNYNIITHDDSVDVINAKLRTDEYNQLNDEQIHTRLVREDACFDCDQFMLLNGQLVRRY